jgi:hypothetical protein
MEVKATKYTRLLSWDFRSVVLESGMISMMLHAWSPV